ncbi:MAG: DUF898 family protein [Alphaproteobacteria bacterium]|nr:DUF898 family protein [Alphaproteobacteria bacterium]
MDQAIDQAVTLRARYAGRARDLYPLYLGTLLLTIITLGFYRFWARTRIRRYIWSRIVVQDDALEYTGTGKELFIGFLKAALILSPLLLGYAALDIAAQLDEALAIYYGAGRVIVYILLLYLFFVGSYAATRYRLSRTRWRSIRFHQGGSPWEYGVMAFGGAILRGLTLGFYTPFNDVKLARYETAHRQFGTAPFGFDGKARPLFWPFARCWVLLPFTLGLSWFWYDARRTRYVVEHTVLESLRFTMSPAVTGWKMARLKIGNMLIALFTLGLGYPIIVRRSMRFWCDNVSAAGTIDFARIGQAAALPGSGEGLAGFFNIDTLGT